MCATKLLLERAFNNIPRFRKSESGKLNLPCFRQRDRSFAADGARESLRRAAPEAYAQFVSGTEYVVRAERNIECRRISNGARARCVRACSIP